MPPTIDYREIVFERARCDPKLREAMLVDGVQCLLAGEVSVATIMLRDYIEVTIGYEKFGALVGTPPESLRQMFGKKGNPSASDLLKIVRCIQQHEGNQFEVKVVPAEADEEEEETEVQMETAAAAAR